MTKTETKTEKKFTEKDYEKRVLELAKTGLTSEKIGQRLKEEGIHPKEFSKKISQILGKNYVNPDLKNVEEKLQRIQRHVEKNNQDKRAKRERERVFSQLRRLKKYFKIE